MVKEGESLNDVQCQDAQALLSAKAKILNAAARAGAENTLPLIFGGDYNGTVSGQPIKSYLEDSGKLVNARLAVDDPTKVDNYVSYGHELVYNETFDYHLLNPYTSGEGKGLENSIDHIYLGNEGVSFTANQYRVIRNLIAGGTADHQPHYVDITLH